MTETELLSKVATEGWTVLKTVEIGQEGTGNDLLVHKSIGVSKASGNILQEKALRYYVKADGTSYWQDSDPFPVISPPSTTFRQEVDAKIAALITAGTIKAAYIERIDETTQTALVVAVKADNTFAPYHVYKVAGALTVTPVTGTYPI